VMVGGFLFGIGMVVGGYCPGTALASVVSGKLDALVYLLGFFIGSLVFGDFYPIWKDFYKSDYRGYWRLDEVFGTSLGRTILIMVVIAVVASLFMRFVQRKVWNNVESTTSGLLKSIQYAVVGLALVMGAAMAFFPNPAFVPSEAVDDSHYLVPRLQNEVPAAATQKTTEVEEE